MRLHYEEGIKGYYSYNDQKRVESTTGVQAIFPITSTFHETDINFAAVDLLTNSNIDANQYATIDYFLKSVKLKTHFSNATNTPIQFWIYDVFNRQNMPPVATYGPSSPITAWTNGLAEQQDVGASATTPFATPFQSKQFTKLYQVAKVTKVTLGVGCDHVHHFKHSPNRKFNDQQNDAAQTNGFFQKTSHTQFIVLLGAIGDDTATELVVSYMPASLNYITYKQYELGCSADSYNVSNSGNNLSTTAVLQRMVENTPAPAGVVDA